MICEFTTYDLCISEGTDYILVFTVADDAGVPIDLTGASAVLNFRLYNVTTGYAGAVNGSSITFTVPATTIFAAYRGTYQVDYTLAGETTRLSRGDVFIEKAL